MGHKARTTKEHNEKAGTLMKAAGYVHKHEDNMHPGKQRTKLAKGGSVKGAKNVTININTGGDKGNQPPPPPRPMPPPPPPGPPPGAQAGPPRPVMPPPGPPPMGPQIAPKPPGAGPMNTGGMVKVRSYYRRRGGAV